MSTTVKESYFWQQVKAGLDDQNTHLSRIENTAGTGISDINVCHRGQEAWIELKVFHGRRLHFRNSQKSWILRRSGVGGRILVLARNQDVLTMYDAAEVVRSTATPGSDSKSFSVDVDALPTPLLTCRKPFRWSEVREKIFEFRQG